MAVTAYNSEEGKSQALVADKLLRSQVTLSAWRYLITVVFGLVLVFELVWKTG